MIGRLGVACLGLLFVGACRIHTPAYEMARSRAEQRIPSSCIRFSEMRLWAVGEDGYLLTAQCMRAAGKLDGSAQLRVDSITYLCRGKECKELARAGNWVKRLRKEPPAGEPPPSEPPASESPAALAEAPPPPARDTARQAIEAELRDLIDAREAAILACVDGKATAVQVEISPERTTISLVGKLAATPAEACVRAALADLDAPDEIGEPLTVRHPVLAN